MNPGGDAAEQVVRLSLEGVEVAAKITGNGAKQIAVLLYAALKQEQKTKGKARLTSMLKSGKELKVYTITQQDLRTFAHEAKRYGVLYCVLKDRNNQDPTAAVDVIARAEDASKIQRITERFRLATVSKATVETERQKEKDALFPKEQPSNPSQARTDRGPLSEPSSRREHPSTGPTSTGRSSKPSVRKKLDEYRQAADRSKGLSAPSRGAAGTAENVLKAAPVPKAPGKER